MIEGIQKSLEEEGSKKIIYLGDGSGDFCPSLKLKGSDSLMPRKNYALCDLVSKNSNKIKAEVHGWIDGEELRQVLLQIINNANIVNIDEGNNNKSCDNSSPIISLDCKLMSPIPIDSHHDFPKVLSVPPLSSS